MTTVGPKSGSCPQVLPSMFASVANGAKSNMPFHGRSSRRMTLKIRSSASCVFSKHNNLNVPSAAPSRTLQTSTAWWSPCQPRRSRAKVARPGLEISNQLVLCQSTPFILALQLGCQEQMSRTAKRDRDGWYICQGCAQSFPCPLPAAKAGRRYTCFNCAKRAKRQKDQQTCRNKNCKQLFFSEAPTPGATPKRQRYCPKCRKTWLTGRKLKTGLELVGRPCYPSALGVFFFQIDNVSFDKLKIPAPLKRCHLLQPSKGTVKPARTVQLEAFTCTIAWRKWKTLCKWNELKQTEKNIAL